MVRLNEQALPEALDAEYLADFCRRYHFIEFGLVGSAARGEMGPDSDYDFLIRFDPDARVSLIDFVTAKLELEDRLGREVDLIDRAMMKNPYRKASISQDLIPPYAA